MMSTGNSTMSLQSCPLEIITVCGDRWETRTTEISESDIIRSRRRPSGERLYPKLLDDMFDSSNSSSTEAPHRDPEHGSAETRHKSTRRETAEDEWKEKSQLDEEMVLVKKPPPPDSSRLGNRRSPQGGAGRKKLSRETSVPERPSSPANDSVADLVDELISESDSVEPARSQKRLAPRDVNCLPQNSSLEESSASLFGGSKEWLAGEDEKFYVEVVPGVEVELRGSYETRNAIASGVVLSKICCMDCTCELNVFPASEYVLCPLCRCVSPLPENPSASSRISGRHGVGIGFVYDGS